MIIDRDLMNASQYAEFKIKMLVNDFGFVLSNEQKEQIRSCKNNFKIDRLARDIIFKKLK